MQLLLDEPPLPRRGPKATAELQIGLAMIAVVIAAFVGLLALLDALL